MSKPLILIVFTAILTLTGCREKAAQQSELPVSPLLGTEIRPLAPTYTPTATFTPTPTPATMVMVRSTPTITAYAQFIKVKPACISTNGFSQCNDPILNISYEYPTEWGEITGTLGNAVFAMKMVGPDLSNYEYAGYSYGYDFSRHFTETQLNGVSSIVAVGRSSVFSVARDGSIYDFGGFTSQDTNKFCRNFSNPNLCRVIKAGVVIAFSFPKAEYECKVPFLTPPPTGFVYINLPSRQLINGFMFAYPLLSLPEEKSLYGILGIGQNDTTSKCEDIQAQKQFDEQISKLASELAAGNAPDDVSQKAHILIRLANSIQGQETGR